MTKKLTEVAEVLPPVDIFAEFATDERAEVDGVWVPYGNGHLLIARADNAYYTEVYMNLYAQNRLVIESGQRELSNAKAKEINIQAMAEAILRGWKNLAYKGQVIEYSVDTAKMLLAHRDFRLWVATKAGEVNLYRNAQEDLEEKN